MLRRECEFKANLGKLATSCLISAPPPQSLQAVVYIWNIPKGLPSAFAWYHWKREEPLGADCWQVFWSLWVCPQGNRGTPPGLFLLFSL